MTRFLKFRHIFFWHTAETSQKPNSCDRICAMATQESFRRTELLFGTEAVEAFARLRIIVFGVGGVGGWCAEALVRSGVGHLTIVDDDLVAASNINRQLPATTQTVGRAKTEVLKERFLAINPSLSLVTHNMRYTSETASFFNLADFDYVIDAIDSVSCKAHLFRRVVGVPSVTLLSSMGSGARVDPARIRATPFAQVQGDGLARALRQRFKRDGAGPLRDFLCVWSDEPAMNHGTRRTEDGTANGSFMPVTATFGLRLAALALNNWCQIGVRRSQ